MASIAGPIVTVVERTVEGLGYALVDFERAGGGLLRVTIERPSEAAITVEDCERVSHQLTHLFAVEELDYDRLEVSSPGLDRPLKSARDFSRFMGAEVHVQLLLAVNGRKRWRGRLVGLEGAAGAERVRLAPLADADAAPVRRVGSGAKAARKAAPQEAPADIEFALADVERARLVPVLDFRSKR